MRTASQLGPCGYVDVLSAKRKRTPSQQAAMDNGTKFHKAVEAWIETGDLPPRFEDEIADWVRLLADTWVPPPGVECELAMGITPEGAAVDVRETEPHVYVPVKPGVTLLTAGRADLAWVEANVSRVPDLKTGRTHLGEPSALPQLRALGFAHAARYGTEAMQLGVYYARDGVWEWSEVIALDSPEAGDMWNELREQALLSPDPRPGSWCSSCWERKGCGHAAVSA